MKKKLALLCMTVLLGSTMGSVNADGYTTLHNEHLDGIVNSDNLAVSTFTNSFGPDGKVKKDWTHDLYIGLKDELKKMVKIEYRKEPGIHHSEVYHEQTVDHIKLYEKSTEAGEYDLSKTEIQSYGMDSTTRDRDGSIIADTSVRPGAITVDVTNRPTVRMGEGEFSVINYGTDSNGHYKRNVVKLSKDGLDNGGNKIINVLPGEVDTDAVNVKQLKGVSNQVNSNTADITDLKSKVSKSGSVVRGRNTYVKKTVDASGNNNFEVGLNNNLYDLGTATFHSDESRPFSGGNSYITGDTMSISNLSNEDNVYVTPTRVTISKLESGLPRESSDLSSSELHIQKFDDNWHHHRTIVDHTGIRSTDNDTGKSVQFSTDIISAGDQQIHDVKAGTELTDAVNVSQLKEVSNQVDINTKDITDLKGKIGGTNILNESKSYTDQRIAKAGAANAALSGLKYLDYDANHKLSAAASFGQYKGATAGAIGLAYQPNEDVLVHLGTTIGSETMVNGGVSIRVGDATKGVKANTKNLAKEMDAIKAENAELKAELAEIKAMLANR
jgi:hemagglutinin